MRTPDWNLVFGGYEVKQDCPLRTKRRLAGLHQIQTTAGSASTTSERMSLLLDRLEDEDGSPLETGIALEIARCLLQAQHRAKQPRPVIPLRTQRKFYSDFNTVILLCLSCFLLPV